MANIVAALGEQLADGSSRRGFLGTMGKITLAAAATAAGLGASSADAGDVCACPYPCCSPSTCTCYQNNCQGKPYCCYTLGYHYTIAPCYLYCGGPLNCYAKCPGVKGNCPAVPQS